MRMKLVSVGLKTECNGEKKKHNSLNVSIKFYRRSQIDRPKFQILFLINPDKFSDDLCINDILMLSMLHLIVGDNYSREYFKVCFKFHACYAVYIEWFSHF